MSVRAPGADIILVGAGLSQCLLAWFLKSRNEHLKVRMFEARSAVPLARTWSFHQTDVGTSFGLVEPLITRRWDGYAVHLPSQSRTFKSAYFSITPERLQDAIAAKLGSDLSYSTPVSSVASDHVVLETGERMDAACVVDGRGNFPVVRRPGGFQKFVGLHFRMAGPHGLVRPELMDARIPQLDGYRFFYLLPWSPNELLIEDTRYSSSPRLDRQRLKTEIYEYAKQRGWRPVELIREESGVLPLPIDDMTSPIPAGQAPRLGVAGGFFHPVTGYSLPDAVRLAKRISELDVLTSESVARALALYADEQSSRNRFYRLLNKMMFLAASPNERYKIFQHFYSLPEPLIQRFYAGTSTLSDQLKILSGRPPVPILSALRAVFIGEATPL